MTDCGILYEDVPINNEVRPDYRTVQINGNVFASDVRNNRIEVIDRGLQFANSIAVGP